MKFDAQRAYHHITQIAFPRAVGSEGESRARDYIVKQLSSLGLEVTRETFRFSKFPAEILPRLFFIGFAVAVIAACWRVANHSIFACLLCVGLLLVSLALTRWQRSLEWLYNVGKAYTSQNIIATTPALSEPDLNFIFVAHYDSKSQVLPIGMRAFCYLASVIGLIGLTALTLFQAVLNWELPPHLIWGICGGICLCLILLQFNFTQNRSPGAFDNASGVGVLLELARCLANAEILPAKKVRFTFLSPGAEEYGMCGALRWIQQHASEFNPDRTYVINIDSVGVIGKITLITRYGIPPTRTSERLGRAICDAGAEIGIEAAEVYTPVGVGFDGIPIASRGFETVTLSAGGFGRAALKIHSERDGMGLIDPDSLQRVGALVLYFVENQERRTEV